MATDPLPLPGPLPVTDLRADLPALALELYRQLAETARQAALRERALGDELAARTRAAERTIARLATGRFEFQRLLDRVERAGTAPDLAGALALQARAWDAELQRAGVEVRDLQGEVLTDELYAQVEVAGAVPDPAVDRPTVRETLVPLVLVGGQVVGAAQVITSVPPPPGGEPREETS